MPRLMTLNIRHGGGTRAEALLATVHRHQPDVLVLTEYRDNRTGQALQAGLHLAGYAFRTASDLQPRQNGILVAARSPFDRRDAPLDLPPEHRHRWLECRFADVTVVGLYFPLGKYKLGLWDTVLASADTRRSEQMLYVGDFNTGKHFIDEAGATFVCMKHFARMETLGHVDAWRSLNPHARDYTWWSNRGNGFRLDHVWMSAASAGRLQSAVIDHAPRVEGATDHSALVIEVS